MTSSDDERRRKANRLTLLGFAVVACGYLAWIVVVLTS